LPRSESAVSDPWLERLTGARSSKPTFYAEWRRTSHGLDRAIEALRAISAALCTTTSGPSALCDAVVSALATHFGATAVSMTLPERGFTGELPPVVSWPADAVPAEFAELERRTCAERWPVTLPGGIAVPITLDSELVGALMVGLPRSTAIDDSDVSILQTVANQLAVALRNACHYQEANRQTRELEERNRQLEMAHRRLGEAAQRQLIAQERHRIARELHDSVAQHLISIGMNLEWCRQREPTSSAVSRRVAVTKELARSALTQMRVAIFELSELDTRRAGMPGVLRDLAKEFRAITPLRVRVHVRGEAVALPMTVQHALFHIAQEAMFNVVRHAHARCIWVELRYDQGTVRLSVADDGTGDAHAVRRQLSRAASAATDSADHHGLLNIAERAREAHGSVRVLARRGGGVRVAVTVPLPSAEDDGGADR
jgi:signal transduction histidine kinase